MKKHVLENATVWRGEALAVLKRLKSKSVQCIVTSPPYFGLRDYKTGSWVGGSKKCNHAAARNKTRFERDGLSDKQASNAGSDGDEGAWKDKCPTCGAKRKDLQVGIEPTPKEFIKRLVRIFREARRVLRDDGTLWVNLGDSYAAQRSGTSMPAETLAGGKGGKGSEKTKRGRGDAYHAHRNAAAIGLKHKDRIGIPHMFAFAMREDGWYWRDEIVWHKPNGMTESITDRCTKAHEFIFMFSKSERYYFDYFAIRESGHKNEDGEFDPSDENSRNKRSVWKVTVGADRIKHFATYPPKLIVPCILAGTSQGGCCADCGSPYERVLKRKRIPTRPGKDTKVSGKSPTEIGNRDPKRHIVSVKSIGWRKTCECETAGVGKCAVLDPFCGSGTTLMIAIEKGCEGIGIELNKDYIQFIKTKVKKANRRRGLFA